MRIRPRNYSTACAPSRDSAKLCRLAHVQCVTFFAHAVAQQFCAEAVDESAHESHTRQREPHTAHDTPHTTHQRGDCPSRTLPNNVARNSPRSFFDYASKRCNSNAANSKFEIVSRELRATLIEQARRRPTARHGTRRQAGPQAPRQDPGVRRHREPGRLVTTVNAATASSIEESGPALR